ncbi:MAG: hypothetical protein CSA35_01685 [Dethiosulfovibrio peptidovorans]|nr:MAG: hypothetical protein CSA35_01685 [Dethiosulfovibrio peptidovorans]
MTKKTSRDRDPEGTKRKVLQAAETTFAERGFAGTSIREIARRSGVSGPLILFHFQSKEGVYETVKEEICRRWYESQSFVMDPEFSGSTKDFFRHMIENSFAFYRDNPTMILLANWGRLEGDNEPWGEEDRYHRQCKQFIQEAQERGDVRSDIAPMTIATAICGAIHIWWEFREHIQQGNCQVVSDEAYMNQLTDLFITGLGISTNDDEGGTQT